MTDLGHVEGSPGSIVARDLKNCGISNSMDGMEDDAMWDDSDKENSNVCEISDCNSDDITAD